MSQLENSRGSRLAPLSGTQPMSFSFVKLSTMWQKAYWTKAGAVSLLTIQVTTGQTLLLRSSPSLNCCESQSPVTLPLATSVG